MKKLFDILQKNEWFSEKEIKELCSSDIQACIKNCERPAKDNIFNAFENLRPQDVKVLIIGQDPYPDAKGKEIADGLAFSSKNGDVCPKSLQKIFEEIKREYKSCDFKSNNLTCWKKQGVLLLNSSLTFSSDVSVDNTSKVWKLFISSAIDKVLKADKPLVVMLWGDKAKKVFGNRRKYDKKVLVLQSSHPSPRNPKYDTFAGSNHFKKCNDFLKSHKVEIVEWWKTI